MADFGSLFDKWKKEAEQKRAEENVQREAERVETQARFDEIMRPIYEIVDPAFAEAATQLRGRGIALRINYNADLLWQGSEKRTAKHYQFQLQQRALGSTYNFSVHGKATLTCMILKNVYGNHNRGEQLLHCDLRELTREMADGLVSEAIRELASIG